MFSWDNFSVSLAIIKKDSPKPKYFPVLFLDSPRETPEVIEPLAWEQSVMFHSMLEGEALTITETCWGLWVGDSVWVHTKAWEGILQHMEARFQP